MKCKVANILQMFAEEKVMFSNYQTYHRSTRKDQHRHQFPHITIAVYSSPIHAKAFELGDGKRVHQGLK